MKAKLLTALFKFVLWLTGAEKVETYGIPYPELCDDCEARLEKIGKIRPCLECREAENKFWEAIKAKDAE